MESVKHWKGKVRLEKILLESEWDIYLRDGEDSFLFKTDLGERGYWPDALDFREWEWLVCIEVDGFKGHTTKRDLAKMKIRDETFLKNDIRTVRILLADLVGAKKQDDSLIKREIEYQLS